jgi:hypothetical protein
MVPEHCKSLCFAWSRGVALWCASTHMCAFAVQFFGDDQDGSPAFFDYDAPTITAVVTSLVSNGSAAASDVVARLGPVDLADVRQVSVLGTNLGSAALLSGTGIGFALMVQERVPGQVGPDPAGWSALPTPQVRIPACTCPALLHCLCCVAQRTAQIWFSRAS